MKLHRTSRKSIRNGKPLLPYSRQTIDDADRKAVLDALDSPHIAGNGPLTQAFEDALCEYTGYSYCVAVNNGTSALHLAYLCAANTWNWNYISTTPLTFVATASAAIHADLNVILCDIHPDTYVLDASYEYHNVPVSFAGYPANGEITDDCHLLRRDMANRQGVKISVLSFHPVKAITTMEGGAVLTNDAAIADYCRSVRDHGRIAGQAHVPGFNYRLPDVCCALGLSQLAKADAFNERRTEIAQRYLSHWQNDTRIKLPADHAEHGWHLFVVRVKDRFKFRESLLANGVSTQIHYELINNLPIYRNCDRIAISSSVNQHDLQLIGSRIVSIPLFAGMTDDDVQDVIDAVDLALKENK